MADLTALNTQFGLPDHLVFKQDKDGLPYADIRSEHASARILLQGAQVISWIPRGEKPVIWLSQQARYIPGKSARGGIPICWPWFGPHADARLPAHGFARGMDWDVLHSGTLDNGHIRVAFRLEQNAQTRTMWPYATSVECHIGVGESLEIELITRNEQEQPVALSEALHTYFAIGDIEGTKVLGLEKAEYIDKVDGAKRKQQAGPVTIDGEVDRVYVNTTADCFIDDPHWQRKIHVRKRGSQSTVVWNPWREKADKMGDLGEAGFRSMLCVESGNAADNAITLAPGGEHRLWVSYRVERHR